MNDSDAHRIVVERRREVRFGMDLSGAAWRMEPPWQYARGKTLDVSRSGLAFLVGRDDASAFATGDTIRFEIGVCVDLPHGAEAVLQGGGTIVRVEQVPGWPPQSLLGVRTDMVRLTRRRHAGGEFGGPGLAQAS
ncbi:MAG: PilZ domain-containing protein [Acidobacteria bacterium]|nr:PilZ domain-containing protein [Acidobacteriota bacterium]